MSFVKGITIALRPPKTAGWEGATGAVVVVGLAILCCFGVQRMSVYWSRDEAQYYNYHYATVPGNIDSVIIHATFGFFSFLCVPMWLLVAYFFSNNRCAMVSATVATILILVATVVTVPLIKDSILGSLSGTAVVLTAGIWALWWFVSVIASGIQYVRKRMDDTWGAWAWWIRFFGMSVFGFSLTPIFYALKGHHVGSAIALIFLLAVHVVLSEWIVRRGANGVTEAKNSPHMSEDLRPKY